jgi:vancomycin resistance protein YoaR
MDDYPTQSLAVRAAVLGVLCGIGVLCGLVLMPEPQAHAALPVVIRVAGQPVAPATALEDEAATLAERYLGATLVLQAPGAEFRLRRADLGVKIDLEHLRDLLRHADDPQSSMRRLHQAALAKRPLELPMPAQVDVERTSQLLLELKDRIDRKPIDARLDPRTKRAVPASPGVALDLYASLARIDRALGRGDAVVQLATVPVPAARDRLDLQHIEMNAVLGEFTTRYARGRDTRDRTHNLRVAAQRLDGHVIAPGEIFDFNAVVGDRTTLNGFRMAKVIADGQLVEGMGGGTCQIASTLHAAAFFAGLPVLTRYPHSHPSFYIKLGLDATVVYGSLDLRFQNDRPYPLVIDVTVEDGFVHAALHGKERTSTVTFLRRIDEVSPFDEKVVADAELPRGMRILQQRGVPGFKITRLRVVKDELTQVARRERSTDLYPPSAQIWRVGTGPVTGSDYQPPSSDAHPEYVADEFMIATQGPRTDGVEMTSTPGRTGTFGWTEREKMMRSASRAAPNGT